MPTDKHGNHAQRRQRRDLGQFGDQRRESRQGTRRDLHQGERLRVARLHIGHGGAHQRRFAHPPRAPQQHIMRRRP